MTERSIPAELVQLSERLHTQDNRATAWPLYVVEEQERVYGIDLGFADSTMVGYIWMSEGDSEYCHETDADLLAEYPNESWALEDFTTRVRSKEGHVWEKIYYARRWRFVCAHLTERAAEDYIHVNAHNLKNPRIYVTSQHRCPEWIAVRDFLLGLTAASEVPEM